jgi:5-oxopent-3-ene-1,2,5-tricarboxylate decarboxylase/2-hydroxyhepta-2,4-diene-1,7-dioate isomerase
MKHAWVLHEGRRCHGVAHEQGLLLDDGRLLPLDGLHWLPPLAPVPQARTILALGQNYLDPGRELSWRSAKEAKEPEVFIKTESTLLGHGGHTARPMDVAHMHAECELVVVIGRTTRQVDVTQARSHIAGYTVGNDYTIRDYLENWYRPNLRVKNRDAGTPLGPWLVDAADVPDPRNLRLRTRINGRLVQEANTGDMQWSADALVAHVSSFMTLQAGDLIFTGSPAGVDDCQPGDEVETEIDGIGVLRNTIVRALV